MPEGPVLACEIGARPRAWSLHCRDAMPVPASSGWTPMAVFGDLRRSPLAGVLISALNDGVSGTLVIDPDEKHLKRAMVLIQGGALVAVEGSSAAGFETQVLSLFARRG